MKYIKTICMFLISLNLSALCAATTITEPTLSADIQNADLTIEGNEANATTTPSPAEENKLQDWNDHLKKLNVPGDNWVAENNVPTDSWTTEAFDLAEKAMALDATLSEELKSSFSNAMQEKLTLESGTDTLSYKLLIKNFDDKIEELKKQATPEPVAEESATTTSTNEATPTPETEQPAEVVTTPTESTTSTSATSSTETSTASTDNKTEPEKKEEPKKEEKKENFIEEWNKCLQEIQSKNSDLDTLTDTAAELAKKLQKPDPEKNPKPMKITDLTQAFDRALLKRGLSSDQRESTFRDFASMLGIDMPTSTNNASMDYYPPTDLTLLAQEKKVLAAMQHEQDERLKAAELAAKNKAMVTEAALLKSTEDWKTRHDSLTKSEERRLALLEKKDEESKAKIKALEDKIQKAIAEKSLFTRAKEKVSETVSWYTGGKKPAEESTSQEKKELEEEHAKILQEKEELSRQMRCKREQRELARLKREEREHELSKTEADRKVVLEAEQKECNRIADLNNFEREQKEWAAFMDSISRMKKATMKSNEEITDEAITKATAIINPASRIPSIDILEVEQMLKTTFANALLTQQGGNEVHLNTITNQHKFDQAINNIGKQKGQP